MKYVGLDGAASSPGRRSMHLNKSLSRVVRLSSSKNLQGLKTADGSISLESGLTLARTVAFIPW